MNRTFDFILNRPHKLCVMKMMVDTDIEQVVLYKAVIKAFASLTLFNFFSYDAGLMEHPACTWSHISELPTSLFSPRQVLRLYNCSRQERDYSRSKFRLNRSFGCSVVSVFFPLFFHFVSFLSFAFRSDLPVSHSDAEALHHIHRIKYTYISRYTSCIDLDASVDI